jgi:hypothetical protein
MPKPGEIKRDYYQHGHYNVKSTWVICPECQQGRWIQLASTKGAAFTGLCSPCYLKVKKRPMLKATQEIRDATK